MNAGIIGRAELREWYLGETKEQAQTAIQNILAEAMAGMMQQIQE